MTSRILKNSKIVKLLTGFRFDRWVIFMNYRRNTFHELCLKLATQVHYFNIRACANKLKKFKLENFLHTFKLCCRTLGSNKILQKRYKKREMYIFLESAYMFTYIILYKNSLSLSLLLLFSLELLWDEDMKIQLTWQISKI